MSDRATIEKKAAEGKTAGHATGERRQPTDRPGWPRRAPPLALSSLALLCCVTRPLPPAQTQPRPEPAVDTRAAVPGPAKSPPEATPSPTSLAPLELLGQLTAPSPRADQGFASTVAISGSTVVIGAPSASGEDNLRSGRVYIYGPGKASWELLQVLASPAPQAGERFGESVAILNNTLVVNAPNRRVTSTWGRRHEGQVYVFVRQGDTWRLQAALHEVLLARNSIAVVGDVRYPFGRRFALANNAIMISPRSEEEIPHSFAWDGSSWIYEGQLPEKANPKCPALYDAIYSSDGSLVLTSPCLMTVRYGDDRHDQMNVERAYLWQRKGNTWAPELALRRSYDDDEPQDDFGRGAAVSGNTVAVGAPKPLQGGTSDPGEVVIYERAGSDWSLHQELGASPKRAGDQFGRHVALAGDRLVVSSRDPDLEQARLHFFFRRGGKWQLVQTHALEIPALDPFLHRGEPSAGFTSTLSLAIAEDLVVIGINTDKPAPNSPPERALLFRFRGAP